MCPANWNMAKGSAVIRTSRLGYRMPFLRAGMLLLREGNMVERYTNDKHHRDTNANCTIVSVTGLGRAFKMDFEDVLVTADVRYQTRHKTWYGISHCVKLTGLGRIAYNQAI